MKFENQQLQEKVYFQNRQVTQLEKSRKDLRTQNQQLLKQIELLQTHQEISVGMEGGEGGEGCEGGEGTTDKKGSHHNWRKDLQLSSTFEEKSQDDIVRQLSSQIECLMKQNNELRVLKQTQSKWEFDAGENWGAAAEGAEVAEEDNYIKKISRKSKRRKMRTYLSNNLD